MAGLLNQAPPQGGPPRAGMTETETEPGMGEEAPVGAAPEGEEQESNVSPEEQAQYDLFVKNGMKLMYSDQVMPKILEAIKTSENPVHGLGNALAMIVMRLEDSAEKAGQEISGDAKFHGASELMEQLTELAQEAGIHEFTEKEVEAAYYYGLDVYRETRQKQGKLDVNAMKGDMQELVAADQEGRADEVLPGISEFAKNAPPAGGQPDAGEGEQPEE